MLVTRLEALADAIVSLTGWHDPESPVYQTRNPGNLPAVSPKHPKDARGKRVFHSALDGYQALLFDLKVKCDGNSRARLTKDSTLTDLMVSYGQPATAGKYVAKFLRRALQDPSLSDSTPLSYFMETLNGRP